MKQPKLSVTTDDLPENIKKLLIIPEGKKCSSVIVGLIGDEYTSSSGKNTFIPVTLLQNRKDASSSESQSNTEASKFFRGWNGYEKVLRCTENVEKHIFDEMKFTEGTIIEGSNLAVDYSLEPFYPEQEPVMNPVTGQYVTSNGQYLYRNVRFTFGEPEHTGLELVKDKSELTEVKDTFAVETDEGTF